MEKSQDKQSIAVLERIDPGTDREIGTNRGDDRVAVIEHLDPSLSLCEILLCTANNDIAIAPVTMTHHYKRFNVDEHFLVNVLWLPGDHIAADPKRTTVYGTVAKDLR